jgi:hypothetical protein
LTTELLLTQINAPSDENSTFVLARLFLREQTCHPFLL